MERKNKMATAGMVLGLISIIGWIVPLVGFPLTILAIIFGSLGLKSDKKGRAKVGLILGVVFFVITLASFTYAFLNFT